jgi:hypothetical protein
LFSAPKKEDNQVHFIGGPDIGIEPFLLLIIPSSMVKESCNVLHLDDLIEEMETLD